MPGDGALKPSPVHGAMGYLHYGCRCPVCTAANTARAKRQRAARFLRMKAGDPAVPHGTAGGYSNWGCRCPKCTKANTDACMERRDLRKKTQAEPGSVTIP